MRNMRLFKNNSIAKAFLICLLILSLIGCMAGCNQKTDADAPVHQSEGWAEKSFRNKMADASVTEVVIDDALVLASPVEVAGNKVISGEGSITAIAKNREGDYMIVVPSGVALTVKGSVTIDAAGVMGGVHVQKDASFTLEESAAVKNASVMAANALVEGKLLVSGGTLADANGHNIYNKNETVISGGMVTGSGEKFAGVYNAGKLTQDDGSISAAYYNVVSLDGSSYTFNKGSVADSVNNGIVIEKGASLKITSKDATITGAGARGIYLSGEAVIDNVTLKNSYDSLIKVTDTGKLTVNDGTISDAGYHGIDNAGTLLVNGGTIYNSYSCGIVNTGSLEMTGGSLMNNANKGILNKLDGVAKVVSEDVYLSGNYFAIGNEDDAYFELSKATFSSSTNANIYAYGGEMYIHDISLGKSASNNVRVVAAKITMENVDVLGNATSGSSTMHGILLEGGSVDAKNVTIIGTTGNAIRNKGGKFVGTNIAIKSIGNNGVSNTNQDFTGREGIVIIDGLTAETVRYNNLLAEGGAMTITNAVLNESGTNNIKVSGGTLNLTNVDVLGNIKDAATNVHGIYTTGGLIVGNNVRVTNTRGAALRVAGAEAVVNLNGFTTENLNLYAVSVSDGTVNLSNAVLSKTSSNSVRIDNGYMTLNKVTVAGHFETSANNVHGVYATGGKLIAEELTVTGTTGSGIRNNGGNIEINGLNVENVGTHTLQLSNENSVTTIVNGTLGATSNNNIMFTNGVLNLSDSKVLGQTEGGAQNMHGILTGGGEVNMTNVTFTGTSGSAIRNKGAIFTGKDIVIENFNGYNALSNAASDSGECGELNVDGLVVTNALNADTSLAVLVNQCDGKVNISNAKFTPNTETVKAVANVIVDAGTVVLDNIQMEVVTSNSFRVNGGNVTLTNSTIPGHLEGSASNVNAFYTVGGTTHLENVTITNPTGDGIRVNISADDDGNVISEPTVTAKNVTVTGAGRHSMWVSGGSVVLEDSTLSGLKSNMNNVLVSGGAAKLANIVADKVNANNNICIEGGTLDVQNVQILGHNDVANTSNHGLYAKGGKVTGKDLDIQNAAGSGIRVDNDAVIDLKNVKIDTTGQHGIRTGDAGEEASNNLKVSIDGLTISNTTTNNILNENGEMTIKNAVLNESTSNNIKLIGGKLNLDNVQVLGHRDGVRSDNHGIFIEITKNSTATLNAKDVLVSGTAGQALRNKGGVTEVDGLVLNSIGADTLISNVTQNSIPGELTISRLGISEGCEHARYAVHNQDGKSTLNISDSVLLLASKTVGVYAEYGKVTVENTIISGAAIAIHNKAELTINSGSLHNNGWSVRNEEGAKATLNGGYYYGNQEGNLPSDIYNGGELTISDITVGYNKKGNGKAGVIYQAATATPIVMKGDTLGLHSASKKLNLAAEEWVQKWGTDKNVIVNCDSVPDALEAERFFDPGIEDPKMYVSAVGSNLELTTFQGGNFIVQIGTEKFTSFADALAYIEANDEFDTTEGGFEKAATIQIIDSYLHFENVVIPEGYNITLVDDGTDNHTVAYDSRLTGDMFTVPEGAQLNLKATANTNPDSGLTFSGSTDSAKKAAVFCVDGGVVMLESDLNITNAYYGISLVDGEFDANEMNINTAGTYGVNAVGGEMNDATLNGSGSAAIYVGATETGSELSNITINGYTDGIRSTDGKLTVDGLTVNDPGTAGIYLTGNGGNVTINNLNVVDTDKTDNVTFAHGIKIEKGEISVNGGTFDKSNARSIRMYAGSTVNLSGEVNLLGSNGDTIYVEADSVLNVNSGKLTVSNAASNGMLVYGTVNVTNTEALSISNADGSGIYLGNSGKMYAEDAVEITISNVVTGIASRDDDCLFSATEDVTVAISNVAAAGISSGGGDVKIEGKSLSITNCGTGTNQDNNNIVIWGAAADVVIKNATLGKTTDDNQNSNDDGHNVEVMAGTLTIKGTTTIQGTSAGQGIYVYGNGAVVNLDGTLTINDAADCAIKAESGGKFIATETSSLTTGYAEGSTTQTNYSIYATGSGTEVTVYDATLGKTYSNNVGTYSSAVVTINGTAAKNSVIKGNQGEKYPIHGAIVTGGTLNLNYVTIESAKGAGIRSNNGSSVVNANNVTITNTGDHGISLGEGSVNLSGTTTIGTAEGPIGNNGIHVDFGKLTATGTLNITNAANYGIRATQKESVVELKNTTIQNCKRGIELANGTVTVLDNGDDNTASLVITNCQDRGIAVGAGGTVTIQDDVTVSSDAKKSYALETWSGGVITAVDGTKVTITGTEYGLYSWNNSVISLDEVTISGVKENSIRVDGNDGADASRTGVTVKSGSIETTDAAFNIYVHDDGRLSLSDATIEHTSTVTWAHGSDNINTAVHVMNNSVVSLDNVTITGGKYGIRVHTSDYVTLNDVTISDAREHGIFLQATPKVTVTGELEISNTSQNAIRINTGTLDASNATSVTITDCGYYDSDDPDNKSNSQGMYLSGSATINNLTMTNTGAQVVNYHSIKLDNDNASLTLNGTTNIGNSVSNNVSVTKGTLNLNGTVEIGQNDSNYGISIETGAKAVNITGSLTAGGKSGSIVHRGGVLNLKDATLACTTANKHCVRVEKSAATVNAFGKVVAEIYFSADNALNVVEPLTEGSSITLSWDDKVRPADYVAANFTKTVTEGETTTTQPDADSMNACEAGGYLIAPESGNYTLRYMTLSDGRTVAKLVPKLVMSEADLDVLIELAKLDNVTDPTFTVGASFSVGKQIDLSDFTSVTIQDDGNAETGSTITYNGSATGNFFLGDSVTTLSLSGITLDCSDKVNLQVAAGDTLNLTDVTVLQGNNRAIDAQGNVHIAGAVKVNDTTYGKERYAIVMRESAQLTSAADSSISIDGGQYGLVVWHNAVCTVESLTTTGLTHGGIYINQNGKLTVNGGSITGASASNNVYIQGSATVDISNMEIKDAANRNIEIKGSATTTFTDCTISGGGYNVYVEGSGNTTFDGVTFGKSGSNNVVLQTGTPTVNMIDVTIQGITGTETMHDLFVKAGTVNLYGDTEIYGAPASGIRISGGTVKMIDTDEAEATLYIHDCGDDGINMTGGTFVGHNVTAHANGADNTVDGTATLYSGKYGFYYTGGSVTLGGKVDTDIMSWGKTLIIDGVLDAGSAITIDWAKEVNVNNTFDHTEVAIPASGIGVQFDSADAMNANKDYFTVVGYAAEKYAAYYYDKAMYLNDRANLSLTVTNYQELLDALDYIKTNATEPVKAAITVAGNIDAEASINVPAGWDLTLKADAAANNRTISAADSMTDITMFTLGEGAELTLTDVTVDGGSKANVQVPTGTTLNLGDTTLANLKGVGVDVYGTVTATGTINIDTTGNDAIKVQSGGSFTGATVNVDKAAAAGLSMAGGTVNVSTLNISNSAKAPIWMNAGSVTIDNVSITGSTSSVYTQGTAELTINGGTIHGGVSFNGTSIVSLKNVTTYQTNGNNVAIDGATVTLDGVTVDGSGTGASHHGIMMKSGSVIVKNELKIQNTSGAGIRMSGGGTFTATETGAKVTISNTGTHGISNYNGSLTIADLTVTNPGNHGVYADYLGTNALSGVIVTGTKDGYHDIYVTSTTDKALQLSGKINADVYCDVAVPVYVTGALASGSDVTVDWAVGKEPATAISFKDAATLTASRGYITLGETQTAAGKTIAYGETDATLVAFTEITSWADLSTAVSALSDGNQAFYKVTGDSANWAASSALAIPSGVEVTLIGDENSPAIIASTNVSPFTLGSGTVLTLENLTVGGASAEAMAGQTVVPTGASVYLQNSVVQYCQSATSDNETGSGGAFNVKNGGYLSAVKTTFNGNASVNKWGGAIGLWGGKADIMDCVFTKNTAKASGGAIMVYKKSGVSASLSVSNSQFSENSATVNGGAIAFWGNGSSTVTNCEFTDNSAKQGGAINISESGTSVTITGSNFTENGATAVGGVIFAEDNTSLTINDTAGACEFYKNSGTEGGVIYTTSSLNITGAKFVENNATTARGGAVMIMNAPTVTFTNCEFTGNTAATQGGAVGKGGSAGGVLTITGCTFANNTAQAGEGAGALMLQSSPSVTISNSTFTGNHANVNGGAIKNNSSTTALKITGSTFAENTADGDGGAIYNQAGGTYYISGCTFTDNDAVGNGDAICNAGGTVELSGGCTFNGAADPAVGQISGNVSTK